MEITILGVTENVVDVPFIGIECVLFTYKSRVPVTLDVRLYDTHGVS